MSDQDKLCIECGGILPHATVICVRNLQKTLAEGLNVRALSALSTLYDYFLESHQEEIEGGHAGDDAAGYNCSYCTALKEAKAVLDEAGDISQRIVVHVEGGAVQDVYTDIPNATYTVIDCDTDGGVEPPLYNGLIVADWATKTGEELEGDLKKALEAHDQGNPDPVEE